MTNIEGFIGHRQHISGNLSLDHYWIVLLRYSQLLLPVQVVLLCMDFVLNECLHNTKLPVRYISCEVYESLGLNCFRVVSERCEFRTNRNCSLTLRLGRVNKLSLNRRDSRAVRFGLQKVPALFLRKTNIEYKTLCSTGAMHKTQLATFEESELGEGAW